jgi:S1-C subfamily serine protease
VSLAGTWIGIYQVYPAYIQMTLKIASEPGANGETTAEMRVEGLEGKNAPQMGVSAATVRYQPGARALDITATGDASRRTALSGLSFHAVYDADRRAFAGYRVNASSDASPYFLLVRQGQEGKFYDRIEDMPNGAAARPRPAFSLGGDSPSADSLRTWASQIYKEYPSIDPYHTESGAFFLIGRNLFRDEYFKSFFGKTYDELGGNDMAKVNGRLEGMPPPRANFPEDKANGAGLSLARGFWMNVGTYATPDIMLSVVAMRSISGWMNQTLRRLPEMTPAVGVFDTLNGLEAEERGALGTLWPSERQAFLKALDAQRSRLADPVLLANVTQQVDNATRFDNIPQLQQTVATLRQPATAPVQRAPAANGRTVVAAPVRRAAAGEDIPSLSSMASEAVRQQLRTSVESKIATLVDAEAQRDAATMSNIPAGAEGLEAGAAWFSGMDRKYSSYRSTASVAAMFQRFTQARTTLHTQATPVLKTQIASLNSADQIDKLLSRYVGTASDRSAPTAQPIFTAAQERRAELNRIAAENTRLAAAKAAADKEAARLKAESVWRRPKPPENQVIRIGLVDMLPKPNATPLQQASEAVVVVLAPDSFGSAFLITKDGLAITNNHVVEGASAIKVRFSSGQEFAARVWRTDPVNDFALIQIDCPRDCFTSYLTSDPLPGPGTDVYAIGTPERTSLNNSISKGIVSGLRRTPGKIDIQSDAAVNHGNSGGPMIEAATGRVIGVVTKKITETEGLGFAGSVLDAMRTLGITLE